MSGQNEGQKIFELFSHTIYSRLLLAKAKLLCLPALFMRKKVKYASSLRLGAPLKISGAVKSCDLQSGTDPVSIEARCSGSRPFSRSKVRYAKLHKVAFFLLTKIVWRSTLSAC